MKLSNFNVVHACPEAAVILDDPLVHCFAGNQIVLAYVSRQALMDYFQVPGDKRITLAQWNLVVDRNIEALKPIIEDKFNRDEWDVYNAFKQSYPKVVLTLEDLRQSGEKLTIQVLDIDAGFRPRA
jgi:hypothetical protein